MFTGKKNGETQWDLLQRVSKYQKEPIRTEEYGNWS